MKVENFFENGVAPAQGERIDDLCSCRNVRVERILSPAAFESGPYDQEQDEWVMLLEGTARMEVGEEIVDLAAGDYLFLPTHTPHRVLYTSASPSCRWLAIHVY